MKVNQSGSVWRPYAYSQQTPLSTGPGKRSTGEDQVEISAQAKAMLEAQQKAASSKASKETSLSKQERIEQLKQQIANGTYQVDARKVAERLYNFWFRG